MNKHQFVALGRSHFGRVYAHITYNALTIPILRVLMVALPTSQINPYLVYELVKNYLEDI